jgi:Spx/MgsR family transcriptional regulator
MSESNPPLPNAMSPVQVYGISNCDQVRRALSWLRQHQVAFRFHDFRADGIAAVLLSDWLHRVPWDSLINRRGLTWRRLDAAARAAITDQRSAAEVMLAEPTLIKRPVLRRHDRILVGFSAPLYASFFGADGDGTA